MHLIDWVEIKGAFAFVRVRNPFGEAASITAGDVSDCRNVVYGCGALPHRDFTLKPHSEQTLATVVASDRANGPTFAYRYTAESGQLLFAGAGTSGKVRAAAQQPMSDQEVRAAEALAIGGLRARTAPIPAASPAKAPPPFVAARLVRRGSSPLGIGQSGVARVRVSLGPNGMPHDASIVSITNPQLVAAALETAVSSTYAPAMRNGQPVSGTYLATLQFGGEDPATASIPVWRRSPSPAPSTSH